MGRQYIEGFKDCDINQEELLRIHLTGNHYPPVSLAFIPACQDAIEHCSVGCPELEVKMPNGRTLTAGQIVEGLHLDSFIEG